MEYIGRISLTSGEIVPVSAPHVKRVYDQYTLYGGTSWDGRSTYYDRCEHGVDYEKSITIFNPFNIDKVHVICLHPDHYQGSDTELYKLSEQNERELSRQTMYDLSIDGYVVILK